ncbi:hypothetical protein QL285_033375 [Trifolium repens]|nr:hypothetical protein QL285_033375 [Trifolium repens]
MGGVVRGALLVVFIGDAFRDGDSGTARSSVAKPFPWFRILSLPVPSANLKLFISLRFYFFFRVTKITRKNNSSWKTVFHMESVGSTHKKQHDEDDIINMLPESVITACNASANINLYSYQGGYVEETGSCVCLLLEQFSQVQFMKFQGSEVLMQQNVTMLPLFVMLSYLELRLVTGKVLISLLQKSPVLKTLVIERIYGFDQETLNSSVVPDCLATTLGVVKFNKVDGDKDIVLYLAKFFMENAMVLERMSFSWYLEVKSKEIKEFKEKVFSFKKRVSLIILEFLHDYVTLEYGFI